MPTKPAPLEPQVPGVRRKYPDMSDEERLLRHLHAGIQSMTCARPGR